MIIKCPLFVMLPRVTKDDVKISLSNNRTRNLHYQVLNQAKKAFKQQVINQVVRLPKMNKCHLHFTLYPQTKRLCDISNFCSVCDKFLVDVMVDCGKIKDDNYLYVPEVSYSFGHVDKKDPRIDCEVVEY